MPTKGITSLSEEKRFKMAFENPRLDTEYQTRSETTGLKVHNSFADALRAAQKDPSIWKISYSFRGNRIRLVRDSEKETFRLDNSIEELLRSF